MGGRGISFDDTPSGKCSILSIFITVLKFNGRRKNCVYTIKRLKQNVTIMSKSTIWMYLKLKNFCVIEIEPKIENIVILFSHFSFCAVFVA